MKKYILTVVMFNLLIIGINAQVDFGVHVGIGLSTPQILKNSPNENNTNAGVVTPVFGIYPQAKWKNFILETGIESSQTKTQNESRYNYRESQQTTINTSTISRLSIPLSLGYEFKFRNIAIIPRIGVIRNIREELKKSSTNIYTEGGVTYKHDDDFPYYYYDNSTRKRQYRLLARIDVKFSNRFSLGTQVIFRKSENHSYIDCCFGDCYYGYYGGLSYKRDYRLFAIYRL